MRHLNNKKFAEHVDKDIRCVMRMEYSAEDKIRIVLDGLRGQDSIATLCRREGVSRSMYCTWSKEFVEAGKRHLAGDTAPAASTDAVKDLRREAQEFNEVVVEQTTETLSGWGQFPRHDSLLLKPGTEDEVRACLKACKVIARGNGRAYGDSAIGVERTIHMARFNRLVSFDVKRGILVAEAGVLLADIIKVFLPRGWFPFVVPGTKYVTLGGMIAADVHGKNHNKEGSFGDFVDWIDLMDDTGTILRCSRNENEAIFDRTLGGMGLTGIVLRAAIRLQTVQTGWMRQTTRILPNLDAVLAAFDESRGARYAVAWIDCLSSGTSLGRSVLMLAEHALEHDLPSRHRQAPFKSSQPPIRTLRFGLPKMMLSRAGSRLFNAAYYWWAGHQVGDTLVDLESFFFPLDTILGWNRIYGRKGFMQFQCVLPIATSRDGLHALLHATSQSGSGAFLSVLKRLGPQDRAISFPMEGYTLAMDFPNTPRADQLMSSLDAITLQFGGRFYLAKDSRLKAETLRRSDSRFYEFSEIRRSSGLGHVFQSKQSQRLDL